MTTNLVVADQSCAEKTLCLAVAPSLKSYGISGRARLFEVVQKANEVNILRNSALKSHKFTWASGNRMELDAHPELAVSYITAIPRMALFIVTLWEGQNPQL